MSRASCQQEHRAEDVLPHLPALKLRKTGRGHGEDILKDALQVGSNFPVFSVPPPQKITVQTICIQNIADKSIASITYGS